MGTGTMNFVLVFFKSVLTPLWPLHIVKYPCGQIQEPMIDLKTYCL